MRTIKKPLLFVLSIALLLSCKSDVNKLEVGQKTTIKVKEVYNAGDVIKGEEIKAKFKVTNTGKYPLLISQVKGSCACTIASKPTEPIQPGKSKVISANVKTEKKNAGELTQSVRIVANTVPSITVVRIKANVIVK